VLTNITTDTHGYVAIDDSLSTVYIVFRGTTDLQNWITNLDAFKAADLRLPNCGGNDADILVHDGFYDAYQSVQSQLAQALQLLKNNGKGNYKIVVTGHSLGAALATLAGIQLVCDAPSDDQSLVVYNYGSPRIGNGAFFMFVSGTIGGKMQLLRHTHWRDPVPHLPLMDMDYHHAAREYFLQAAWSPPEGNKSVFECNGSGEDPNCSDQVSNCILHSGPSILSIPMLSQSQSPGQFPPTHQSPSSRILTWTQPSDPPSFI
jgi:hypothetical protein